METAINQIAGVVCCGIFARQHAHVLLLGADDGVKVIR
jgi:ribose 5-phosphate isomerase A